MLKEIEWKFDERGNAKDYFGNTIISFTNSEIFDIYREGIRVAEAFKSSEIGQAYAFLPPSSYHVTILTLCREIDRGTPYWPKMFSPSEQFPNIDEKLKKIVDEIPKPLGIKMKVDQCKPMNISLKPATAEDEKRIRKYRDEVSRAVGIKHPGHEEFIFHMAVSYKVLELTKQEESLEAALCEQYTEILKRNVAPFVLPEPQFVIFNNMLSYETELACRKLV